MVHKTLGHRLSFTIHLSPLNWTLQSQNVQERKGREFLWVRDVTGAQPGDESSCDILKNVKFGQKLPKTKYFTIIGGSVCFLIESGADENDSGAREG